MSDFVTGSSVFSSVTEFDEYMGESTGKYNLTIGLIPEDAAKLGDLGVRLKDYEGTAQRKFTSKFPIEVKDMDDAPFIGEIPRGSEVRVLYTLGDVHPQWGPSTYLEQVRVVVAGEGVTKDVPAEF